MDDSPRLIEVAFPLKQASLDSVHEKNVRHGHISTLHIWPARRPLAACRAALICTLLPDPGNVKEREEILQRLAGRIVRKTQRRKLPSGKVEETISEGTEGGILHWGRESGSDLQWFRQKIREAYGGRPPRVLDPFAGGGAIPLEAMRLGCEATAIDINPVAWFILKCTLEYPQRLAGQKRLLPKFALESPEFMEKFLRNGTTRTNSRRKAQARGGNVQSQMLEVPEADLSWHVRAWGWWVLQRARADIEKFYPLVNGKPTVAYLWARTVTCKNCRATIPLLKTRWLCKKDRKRVVLTMEPNADRTGVVFGVLENVPVAGGNSAQRRERDQKIGAGTMSRAGVTCPCCPTIMTMEDIRTEGQAGRIGALITSVVTDGPRGKEYRTPVVDEIRAADPAAAELNRIFAEIPFGLPTEPVPKGGSGASRAFSVDGYGFDQWCKLFTSRQLLALGTFVKCIREVRNTLRAEDYPEPWVESIFAFLCATADRLADYNSNVCNWDPNGEYITHTFQRFALPIKWDFVEISPFSGATGDYLGGLDWIQRCISHLLDACAVGHASVAAQSALQITNGYDLVLTDPPYYDAIPYSDLMDFFYVWLRRMAHDVSPEYGEAFVTPLGPKWDAERNDGELIDDAARFGGDRKQSRAIYENGMYRAFERCRRVLKENGSMVVVFAHKHPDAWGALVSALIRAGFVVDSSWPIQTEMGNRTRARSSAALSSSVWLTCKPRAAATRAGWDNLVLNDMRQKIHARLRKFWDVGIRGPDFVWAATGPALEAYSKHAIVKKADHPGEVMAVSEFLQHVRRLVVDFVVGRVLSHGDDGETTSELDDVTTYYLLHRHDFKMDDAPIGACILYAISCGLSDSALADQYDILVRTGGRSEIEEEEDEEVSAEDTEDSSSGSGSKVRLKPWNQRKRKGMGYESLGGRTAPIIDQVHRLMHLWKAGDVVKVDEYLANRGLRRNALFHSVLQALIELASHGSEERSLLESISNHIVSRGALPQEEQLGLPTP